ncbi:MAG: N-formylglutamate deformylase [Pseudomonadota bacterium]
MTDFIEVVRGESPLVLGLPHSGTELPDAIRDQLNDQGRTLTDTDWHIDRLYDGLLGDVTTVRTRMHRYAIDVNRDPTGQSLYPGQASTDLCPVTDFDGQDIYPIGAQPDAAMIAQRRDAYHRPYHAAMELELTRLRAIHGFAILYDCHSIRSFIPRLFDNTLPDFNIGTDSGITCDRSIEQAVLAICDRAQGLTSVLNGRFRGGWTTRHYGRPREGTHAIQMELSQATYLSEEAPPWRYDSTRAERLRETLKEILETLREWRPQ